MERYLPTGIDERYLLAGASVSKSGDYHVVQANSADCLQPKKTVEITRELLFLANS